MVLTFIADGAYIVTPRPSKRALFVAFVLVTSQALARLKWLFLRVFYIFFSIFLVFLYIL